MCFKQPPYDVSFYVRMRTKDDGKISHPYRRRTTATSTCMSTTSVYVSLTINSTNLTSVHLLMEHTDASRSPVMYSCNSSDDIPANSQATQLW